MYMRRQIYINSERRIPLNNTRICIPEEPLYRGMFITTVVRQGNRIGGYITKAGFPDPQPFGDSINYLHR